MTSDSLFQYRAYSTHPFIKEQAAKLFERFQASRQRKVVDKKAHTAYSKAFKSALAGLYLGGAYDQQGSFVRVSLNKNHYYGHTRISPIFQPELLKVFRWMIDNKILEMVANSYHDPVRNKDIPRGYRLTDEWLTTSTSHAKIGHEVRLETTRDKTAPLVELRDENKRNLRLKPSKEKDWSIELLTWYNAELERHSFQIGKQDIPPFYCSLTRIYSRGSYELCGRFYSLFQRYKSQTRLHLKIDGENVFEVDLSSLHPLMLYRMAGTALEHDPYDIEGFPRPVVKVAMQILLNTIKPFPPTKSLAYWLNKKKQTNKTDPTWQDIKFTQDFCKKLALAIAKKNKPIAGFLSKRIGLTLQHHDSIFTSAVLHFFKVRAPTSIVIPVHDSYIAKQSELPLLLDAISYAEISLSDHLGWKEINPRIKIESFVLDDPKAYQALLDEWSLPIDSIVKEEHVNNELMSFVNEEHLEQELEEAFLFDSGYG